MKIRVRAAAVVTLALAFVPALSAAKDPPSPVIAATALGDEGQLYELIAGTHGDLFPEDETQPVEVHILALDVVQPDGARERILVPGTADPEMEGAPSLVFEDASRMLYVVWESKKAPTISRLLLAELAPGGWSEPLEISGDVSPLKDVPQVLVTRDRFSLRTAAGRRTTRSRTVIHVVWLEEGSAGEEYYYTPVILEAGRYVGWNPVVALSQLEPEVSAPKAATETRELLRAPALAAGPDVQSAVLGYLSPASGRLVTVEARLLPGELGFLADDIRGDIIEIGGKDRDKIPSLAEKFRDEANDIGHRLNAGVVGHFADRAHRLLLELNEFQPARPIDSLAGDIRGDIIEIGASLLGNPGRHQGVSKRLEVTPILGIGQAPGATNPSVTHLVQLQVVMNRPAPPLAETPARIFVSEDGERALVGWTAQGKAFYTETSSETPTEEGGWTEVKHLTLTEKLGSAVASEILESRVRRRR